MLSAMHGGIPGRNKGKVRMASDGHFEKTGGSIWHPNKQKVIM